MLNKMAASVVAIAGPTAVAAALYLLVLSVWGDLVMIDACYDSARTFNHEQWRCEGAGGAVALAELALSPWQLLKLYGFPLCMSVPVGVLLGVVLKKLVLKKLALN